MATPVGKSTLLASEDCLQRSSQALSVVGNKIYAFGGELRPREPVDNNVYVLDSTEVKGASVETLSAPNESPTPRVGSPGTKIGNAIYLFSGRGGLEMQPLEEGGALWRFDVAQRAWTLVKPADPKSPFPEGRSYHCIASDGTSKVYIHSGCPESGRLTDLWSFDIESKVWTELPSAPPPARGGASIALSGPKLYRMNGFDGNTEQGGSLDVFDLFTNTWSSTTFKADGIEGPEARSVSTLLPVTIHGKSCLVTLFGERDPSSLGHAGAGKMLSDTWLYVIDQDKWQKVQLQGEAPAARGWFDADVRPGGSKNDAIIVHGGLAEDNSRLGDVWRLDIISQDY